MTKAATGNDLEIRIRAKKVLAKIAAEMPMLYAVLKTVAQKRITGTVSELLRVLPLCDKQYLGVAAREALVATARREDEQTLKNALLSHNPDVKAAAIETLAALGGKKKEFVGRLASLSHGLVAYYPFDGDLIDVSGHSNHGVRIGRMDYAHNCIGRALLLDGHGHVTIPMSKTLRFQNAVTFTCWYRISTKDGGVGKRKQEVPSAVQAIFSKGGDRQGLTLLSDVLGKRPQVEVRAFQNGAPIFLGPPRIPSKSTKAQSEPKRVTAFYYMNFSPSRVALQFSAKKPVGRWIHVAVVTGEAGTRLFVDGQLAMSSDKPVDLKIANEKPIHVGIMDALYPLKGAVDELRIYNRRLATHEIKQLYALELAQSAK
ncbi:MAG: LamG domain-containing protein [Planctomycetes bacterium]|nr:LamG domain-containing protein [Planctomycetota bacterium]